MADLATIHDLEADGNSLQQSAIGIHLELTRGMNELPTVRGIDQVVPGRAGRIARARVADILVIELEGFVLAIPDEDDDPDGGISFRTLMGTVRTVFDRTKDPWALEGILEDGSSATISVRCVDLVVDEKVAGLAAEVKVALESVDPDWVITPAP